MKKFVNALKDSSKAKQIIYTLMIIFFGLYIFSTPYFSDRAPFNYLVYVIFAIFTIFVFSYKFLYGDIKKSNYREFIFLIYALFSSISTIFISHEFRTLMSVFLIAISYGVFFIFLDELNDVDFAIRIAIYSLFLFTFLFIIHYRDYFLSPSTWESERLALDNYFDNVNTISYYFAGCTILSLYYTLYGKKKFRLAFLLPYIVCFFLGILTASRSFIACALLVSVVLLIVRFRKKPLKLVIGFIIIVLLIVASFIIPAFNELRDRLTEMIDMITGREYSTDYSTATRVLWQDYALYLGTHHLLFGNGINSFAVLSGTGTYSHANIAELICNSGIIGLCLYYAIPIIAMYDVFTKKFDRKALVICIFAFLFIREFLGVTYYSKFNAFNFALMSYCGYKGVLNKMKAFYWSRNYSALEI